LHLHIKSKESGKTKAIQMLRSFYKVPRIKVDTDNPNIKADSPLENTLKSIFDDDPFKKAEFSKEDDNSIEKTRTKAQKLAYFHKFLISHMMLDLMMSSTNSSCK
jgi:hypothetical protein